MRLLGEQVEFKENLTYALARHWLWWVLLAVTVVMDYLSTLYFMGLHGVRVEGNAVVRWLAFEFGIVYGVMLGKSLQVFAALVFVSLSKKLSRAVLLMLVMLNTVAVIKNLFW